MGRPRCREHPAGGLQRDGYYGKRKEFVRWVCVPGDGAPSHYLRRDQMTTTLRSRLVGGRQGACDECERAWESHDGLPNAAYDRFVLRQKAEALVRIAEGSLTLRGAAREVRMAAIERRSGRRPRRADVSGDGRMARDWVPQYAGIIADRYLPRRWPHTITVDSFDVRVTAVGANGKPLKKGKHLYSVIAAVGYEEGRGAGELWSIAAYAGEGEREFREFFRQLDGRPEVIVCDGAWAIRNAAAAEFPKARVYPCTWHLYNHLKGHVKKAGLYEPNRRIYDTIHKHMFQHPARWDYFKRTFRRYRYADRSKADQRTQEGIEAIISWQRRNRDQVFEMFQSDHHPRDIKHLEEHLDTIQARLGDRRRQFRNLHRLNCVLKLMLLQLRGEASTAAWTRVLREHHLTTGGTPPPRRQHDGELLRPYDRSARGAGTRTRRSPPAATRPVDPGE